MFVAESVTLRGVPPALGLAVATTLHTPKLVTLVVLLVEVLVLVELPPPPPLVGGLPLLPPEAYERLTNKTEIITIEAKDSTDLLGIIYSFLTIA